MPRRRIRRTDGPQRNWKMWAAAKKPGMAGRTVWGGSPGGGGQVAAARGRGGGQPGQVRIEHITLHAEASQTIASGGAAVSWDRFAAAPTEIRGFRTCAEEIASTGAVVAIPLDVTGPAVFEVELEFADNYTTTLSLVRDRAGVETTLATREGHGGAFEWSPHISDLRTDDLVSLHLSHSESGSDGALWGSSAVLWGDPNVLWGDGTVSIVWGRVQITQWAERRVTTPPASVLETMWLDSTVDTVTSSLVLRDGLGYVVRITGNYHQRTENTITEGESDAMLYPSPGGPDPDVAHADAEWVYGYWDSSKNPLPERRGLSWSGVTGRTLRDETLNDDHVYVYDVVGTGTTLTVENTDSGSIGDNNGQLEVEILHGGEVS